MSDETASEASLVSSEQEHSVSEANPTQSAGVSEANRTQSAGNPTQSMPLLQIVTPDTTPEEVAAIVAVFAALGGGAPAPEPARSEWAHPARGLRTPPGELPSHGRGAWRASAFPR